MSSEKTTLYEHLPHTRQVRHPNIVHEQRQAEGGLNTRMAVLITGAVSTMWTAYVFTGLAVIGLLGLLGWLNPFVFLLATWVSQMFLQLVFLPILSVGQDVQSKHAKVVADEQFNTTLNTFHDIEQVGWHLDKQDEKIIAIDEKVSQLSVLLTQLVQAQQESRRKRPAVAVVGATAEKP